MPELVLPHAVLGALWLPSVVAAGPSGSGEGSDVVDAALRAVAGDETHVVLRPDGEVRSLRQMTGRLVGEELTDVGAVLPAPGHVAGLPGVALLDAVDAGQCLLIRSEGGSWAVVPQVESFGSELEPGTLVRWVLHPFPFAERPVPTLLGLTGSLRQARQEIVRALVTAGDALEQLDLAGWRPDVAREAAHLLREDVSSDLLPPGLEPVRVEVLTRAARLLAVVQLALEDDGGAVVARQGAARAEVLRELEHTARRALAAASVSHVSGGVARAR
ncbi:hypothetical protein [Oceanitalea stevensii]|uniref:Uncharacterized protein n=1 Tax=Oceanitalea stevensii TaxID=2763072 RepID=A0ABR8Z2N0_9MICO|nr:hypothetical protein [Oceanitalea stevensii]MBD8062263.1 hypothetical protein [Oceanitalea stevensii]